MSPDDGLLNGTDMDPWEISGPPKEPIHTPTWTPRRTTTSTPSDRLPNDRLPNDREARA